MAINIRTTRSLTMSKPQEFWIKIDHNYGSVIDESDINRAGSIHVIEKLAYDELKEMHDAHKAVAKAEMVGNARLKAQSDKLAKALDEAKMRLEYRPPKGQTIASWNKDGIKNIDEVLKDYRGEHDTISEGTEL